MTTATPAQIREVSRRLSAADFAGTIRSHYPFRDMQFRPFLLKAVEVLPVDRFNMEAPSRDAHNKPPASPASPEGGGMIRRISVIALALLVVLLAGCAGPNPLIGTSGSAGVAGFWAGLWHGLICPITFVISLFNHAVRIYEVHNRGGWYDLGFLIGASTSLGGLKHGSRFARR
jgi:hypothetical protein